jgi:cytochrome P450
MSSEPLPPGRGARRARSWSVCGGDPIGFFERCHARHGDLFTLATGSPGPTVFVARAADAATLRVAETVTSIAARGVADHPLLLLEGRDGPSAGGQVSPAHSDAIAVLAAQEVAGWPVGRPFALRLRLRGLMLDALLRIGFGIDDAQLLGRLRAAAAEFLASTHGAAPWIPALQHTPGPLSPWRRLQRSGQRVDALLREVATTGRPDVALRSFLVGGSEASATAISWVVELAARRPAVWKRLAEERWAGEDAYLDAVTMETTRLIPPVPGLARILAQPLVLGSFELPTGTTVAPALTLVHRDPARWPHAEEFRPERFLTPARGGAGVSTSAVGSHSLGGSVAQLATRIVLGQILQSRVLTPIHRDPDRARLRGAFVVPHRDVPVVASLPWARDRVPTATPRARRVLMRGRYGLPARSAWPETVPACTE